MPCCWPPTETAATSSSPPAAADAASSAVHQASGGDLGAVGMGRAALADHDPGVGVDDDDLAGLRRGVDPRDQRAHVSGRRRGARGRAGRGARSAMPRAPGLVGVERLGAEVGEGLARGRGSVRRAGRRGRRVSACLDLGVGAEGADLLAQDQVVAHAAGRRGPDAVHVLGARRLEVEVARAVVAAVLDDVDGPERAAGVAGAEPQVLVVAGAVSGR